MALEVAADGACVVFVDGVGSFAGLLPQRLRSHAREERGASDAKRRPRVLQPIVAPPRHSSERGRHELRVRRRAGCDAGRRRGGYRASAKHDKHRDERMPRERTCALHGRVRVSRKRWHRAAGQR
jgi:hypothetical protein